VVIVSTLAVLAMLWVPEMAGELEIVVAGMSANDAIVSATVRVQ
jgi:hypothetical protein